MKTVFAHFFLALTVLLLVHCSKGEAADQSAENSSRAGVNDRPFSAPIPTGYSRFLSADSLNRMIRSYLNGIDYQVNTNETRSLMFSADTLRKYLLTGEGKKIKTVRFFLAHNWEYMLSGGEGRRPGPNENAITLVIAGIDSTGNYVPPPKVRTRGGYDFCQGCPSRCIAVGEAASDLLRE